MTISRFPVGQGVAGRVAFTGQTVNLRDAYRCQYFQPGVDHQTGITTRLGKDPVNILKLINGLVY